MASVPPYVLGTSEVRERVRAAARGMVGIGPRSMDVYLRIISPWQQRWNDAAHLWLLEQRLPAASALVVCGVFSCAGIVADEPDEPSGPEFASELLMQLARRFGAWHAVGVPVPGDVVALGPLERAPVWLGRTSRFAVVDAMERGQLLTVEAGEDAENEQAPWAGTVRFCDRTMRYARGAMWLLEGASWRRVVGYVDVDQLPFEMAP